VRTCKTLFIIRFALLGVLVYLTARTVQLPKHLEQALCTPLQPSGDGVRGDRAVDSPALSYEDCAEIVKRNPFNLSDVAAESPEPVAPKDSRDLAESVSDELELELFGTISGSRRFARAIIKDPKTGTCEPYKIGQKVGSAIVDGIGSETVILLLDGRRKTLTFKASSGMSKSDMNSFNNVAQHTSETLDANRADGPPERSEADGQTEGGFVQSISDMGVWQPYFVGEQSENPVITDLGNIRTREDVNLKNEDVMCPIERRQMAVDQKTVRIFKETMLQLAATGDLLKDDKSARQSFDSRQAGINEKSNSMKIAQGR